MLEKQKRCSALRSEDVNRNRIAAQHQYAITKPPEVQAPGVSFAQMVFLSFCLFICYTTTIEHFQDMANYNVKMNKNF